MKTSFKFNQVINDAGQLAPTEGHTDQSSSPRVSSCGLLSFKGDIVKTRKYHTLVGLNTDHVWEIIFGDYDREVVEDEKSDQEDADCSDDYLSFKIIKTNEAQADIYAEVAGLNEAPPKRRFKDAVIKELKALISLDVARSAETLLSVESGKCDQDIKQLEQTASVSDTVDYLIVTT